MKFIAEIDVMPLKELLDPQGKAVASSMKNIGLATIEMVRIGKHIHLELQAGTAEEAEKILQDACKKLLVNAVIEYYEYEIKPA